MDSIALLDSVRDSADMASAIKSLPLFAVVAKGGDYSLLQMSPDWYALLGPHVLEDDGGETLILEFPFLYEWEATSESFGELLLTHFHWAA